MTDKIQIFSIISSIIIAIIYIGSAISKLVFHSKWSHEGCPIEYKLEIYLLYGGIADILWIILFIIAPCFGFEPRTYLVTRTTTRGGQTIKKKEKIEERDGCGSKMVVVALFSLLASFVLSCLGNVWILDKYEHVDFFNSTSSNYCYPPLFKGAFSIVIISDIWYAFLILTIIIVCMKK